MFLPTDSTKKAMDMFPYTHQMLIRERIINMNDYRLQYDPSYVNFIGSVGVLDFNQLTFLSKKERQEAYGVLRSLLPGIELPEK